MWQDILVYIIVAVAVLFTVLHFGRFFRKSGRRSPCDSCPGGCGRGKSCDCDGNQPRRGRGKTA